MQEIVAAKDQSHECRKSSNCDMTFGRSLRLIGCAPQSSGRSWLHGATRGSQFCGTASVCSHLLHFLRIEAHVSGLTIAKEPESRLQLRILTTGDVGRGACDRYIGFDSGIRRGLWRKSANKRQVKLDAGVRQAQEEERASVDSALAASRGSTNQQAQVMPLDVLRKLECGRAVRRVD